MGLQSLGETQPQSEDRLNISQLRRSWGWSSGGWKVGIESTWQRADTSGQHQLLGIIGDGQVHWIPEMAASAA